MIKNKLKKVIRVGWPILALTVGEVMLWRGNVLPNTWLIGWDSTQPELYFSGHLWRDLTAVWQEYRGLGMADGMAHAANLIHVWYIWLLSRVVPVHLVRYAYVFLMHWLGGVGVYWWLHGMKVGKRQVPILAAALGAFWYWLNPITVQMFYQPLELFITHYAFLPWIVGALTAYVYRGGRKRLAIVFGLTLLATPQAHVPTVFIVFAGVVGLALMMGFLAGKRKRALAAGLVVLVANLFWFLPYGWLVSQMAPVIATSRINQLSNQEILLRNNAFGDLKSVALMQGFSLDYEDWQGRTTYGWQMPQWRERWSRPWFEGLGWAIFGLSLAGAVLVWRRGDKQWRFLALVYVMAVVALGPEIPVLGQVRQVLDEYVPYFAQVFRFTFTKFAIVCGLAASGLAAYAVARLMAWRMGKWLGGGLGVGLVAAVIWMQWPVFGGNFLYSQLKQELPSEYLDLFAYFQSPERQGRVALLPMPSLWGWETYRWGYRGSGFIWQGMNNPLLHRSFDAWSGYNETAYLQLSRAIYGHDFAAFARLVGKYGIRWLLIDHSLFLSGGGDDILKTDDLLDALRQRGVIAEPREFGSLLSVYEVLGNDGGFVKAPKEYAVVSGETGKAREDVIYREGGDYVTSNKLQVTSENAIQYPFAQVSREEMTGMGYSDYGVELSRQGLNPGLLVGANLEPGTNLRLRGEIGKQDGAWVIVWEPLVRLMNDEGEVVDIGLTPSHLDQKLIGDESMVAINGEVVELGGQEKMGFEGVRAEVGEPIGVRVYDLGGEKAIPTSGFLTTEVDKCWERSTGGIIESELMGEERKFRVTDASACVALSLGKMNKSGLIRIDLPSRSVEGQPARFCVVKEGEDNVCLQRGNWVAVEAGEVYWLDVIARPPSVVGGTTEIYYSEPKVSWYPETVRTEIASDVWQDLAHWGEESLMPVKEKLTVSLPSRPIEVGWSLRGKPRAENCDLFGRGEVTKVGEEGVVYLAKNRGAACDVVVMDELSNREEYLLRWRGENVSGRSLKLYVFNGASKQNDLETLLPTGKIDVSYGLLSWPNLDDTGYNLTVENRSFGREVSENRIDKVELYPVPWSWLAGLKIVPETQNSGGKIQNNLRVVATNKWGTSHYQLQVTRNLPRRQAGKEQDEDSLGLLALGQGYDAGWTAYAINQNSQAPLRLSSGQAKIKTLLPWWFGERLEHVKVNGWENGWVVSSEQRVADSGNQPFTVVIVYWPQYLEWLGLGILAMSMVYLALRLRSG